MRKRITFILAALLVLAMTACGGNAAVQQQTASPASGADNPAAEASTPGATETPDVPDDTTAAVSDTAAQTDTGAETEASTDSSASDRSDVLVVVFSATGTTKGVAEKIAALEGADLYEITAADPYTSDDLNYNDSNSRSTKEQNDKSVRPAIGSEALDLSQYRTIYIGFPIWWGEEPRIMDTFVESYHFDGITMIPFCTSGGSGIGRSGPNMEALSGSGTWLEGKRFGASVSEAELQSWIDSLKS